MNKRLTMILSFTIPLVLLLYLFYFNLIASSNTENVYDIGGENDIKKSFLYPVERISEPIGAEINYREILSSLVYFKVPVPNAFDEASVELRVMDIFPEGSSLLLGVRDKAEWSYAFHTVYDPLLEKLTDYPHSEGTHKIYSISQNKLAENMADIPSGSVVATDLSIVPPLNNREYDIHDLVVNTTLRGKHTFYVYLKDSLQLQVLKQDLNWYEGADELPIELYDMGGNLKGSFLIADDGSIENSKQVGHIQTGSLNISGLEGGVYRLEFGDFDGLLRGMNLNTNKIVATKLYLADWNGYVPGIERPTSLYFKPTRKGNFQITTYHESSVQNVSIDGYGLSIDSANNIFSHQVSVGEHSMTISHNDLIVTFPGYASFSKDSYFEPFTYTIVSLPLNEQELKENVDYVITDYNTARREGRWIIVSTVFSSEEAYIQNKDLDILIKTPHLSREQYSNVSLPIDSIKTTVTKNGII